MQMQFGRILCGVLIGLIALAWIRPVTEAGSGLVILLSLLLVQVVASLAGVTRRLLRRQPAAETDQGGRPPSALAVLVLLAAAAQFPAHAFEAPPGKGSLSLELVNHSAGTVKSIAVTLGAKVVSEQSITVPPGKQYRVTLPSEGGTCTYDIKVRLEVNKVTISETIRSVNFCTLPSGVLEVKPPASDLSSHRFHEALAEFHALRLPPNATTGSAFGAAPPSVSSPPLAPPVFAPVPPPKEAVTPSGQTQTAPPGSPGLGGVAAAPPPARRLHPARVFLPAKEIPPAGVGAYGVVALRNRPTPATADRLGMACKSFLATLPPQAELPETVSLADQMLTIWPLTTAGSPAAQTEDCPSLLAHYDLDGGLSAIADAETQDRRLEGRGPFLIGWSPSNMRGVPDAIVLIVDMSDFESQQSFDEAFLFWQRKIVEDPQLWRSGFSLERVRLAVRDFVDHYGKSIEAAIKIWVGRG